LTKINPAFPGIPLYDKQSRPFKSPEEVTDTTSLSQEDFHSKESNLPINITNESTDQSTLGDSREEIKFKEHKDKEEVKLKEKEEVKLKEYEKQKEDIITPNMDIKTKRHSLGSSLKIAINKEAFPGIPLYVADDTKKESKKTLIIRPFKGLVKDEETDKPTSLSTKEHKKEKKDRAISPSIKRTGSVDKKKKKKK